MNENNISKIQITNLLEKSSLHVVNEKEGYVVYSTPFRESHSPTFIVTKRNTWCDKGMKDGEGHHIFFKGDIVDLVVALGLAKGRTDASLYLSDFQQERIPYVDVSGGLTCRDRMVQHTPLSSFPSPGRLKILEVQDTITDKYLVGQLVYEDIDLGIANYYLREATIEQGKYVRFVDPVLLFGTDYGSSLSFTPFETKFIGKASITRFHREGEPSCTIFTHVFDFLRGLSCGKDFGNDVIITNHLSLIPGALEIGKAYDRVTVILRENQHAEEICRQIRQTIPWSFIYLIT